MALAAALPGSAAGGLMAGGAAGGLSAGGLVAGGAAAGGLVAGGLPRRVHRLVQARTSRQYQRRSAQALPPSGTN